MRVYDSVCAVRVRVGLVLATAWLLLLLLHALRLCVCVWVKEDSSQCVSAEKITGGHLGKIHIHAAAAAAWGEGPHSLSRLHYCRRRPRGGAWPATPREQT